MCALGRTSCYPACTQSDCWKQLDIETLREKQQMQLSYGDVPVSCSRPFLGPMPQRDVVCSGLKDGNQDITPNRHAIPWPCCGSRLEHRDLTWRSQQVPFRAQIPFRKPEVRKLAYLVCSNEGPGLIILNYLGRHLASLLVSGLWRYGVWNLTAPDFMSLNRAASKLNVRSPIIIYNNPVQRVLAVTAELTNFISRHVINQRLVSVISHEWAGKIHSTVYDLRGTVKGAILSGDGAPESEYSGNGIWYEAQTISGCWIEQLKHRIAHQNYHAQWRIVIDACLSTKTRLSLAFRAMGEDLFCPLIPHRAHPAILAVIALAVSESIEPVWYSRNETSHVRVTRYEGAKALQFWASAALPPVYWDSRPCALCSASAVEWESISEWADKSRISWLEVKSANSSNSGTQERITVWGNQADGAVEIWGQANNQNEDETETATDQDDAQSIDEACANHGWDGQDPDPEQEQEDMKFQTWLENDAHWESPPEEKERSAWDTTDTEEEMPCGNSAATAIEISDDEDTPRLEEYDDGHGRADIEDCESPFAYN